MYRAGLNQSPLYQVGLSQSFYNKIVQDLTSPSIILSVQDFSSPEYQEK